MFVVQNVVVNRNHTKLNKIKTSKLTSSKEKIKLPAVSIIQKKIQKNQSKRSKKSGTNHEDTRCYLNFLGFCRKLNLSFNQISQLGKYLNELAKEDKLGFLENLLLREKKMTGTYK